MSLWDRIKSERPSWVKGSRLIWEIEGTENMRTIFRQFPQEGFRKPILSAFKKAAEPVKRAMVNGVPFEIYSTTKAIKIRTYRSEEPVVAVGVFRKGITYQNRRGITWNPYMLLYWANYGTYANRATDHQFLRARGKKSATRPGGIKPGRFFESAWESSKGEAQSTFEKIVDEEMVKFLNKNANK